MFQVKAPVVIILTIGAREALGVQTEPAARAAWREIARRGQGIEYAHVQIVWAGVTLAIASRVRPDGLIELAIGLGDPRQAARVITAAELRMAEARAKLRNGAAYGRKGRPR